MPGKKATLYMFCGKIAAGKSTLAATLAATNQAVLIAEDAWLSALFSHELSSAKDYMRCASRLRKVMGPHVATLLKTGVSVVLDFQANTIESRAWMRRIVEETGANNQLHVLSPPDEVCLSRLRARNAIGEHPFSVSDEQFHEVSRYFVPPTEDEGFTLVIHDDTA
ncbi:AAA family ATPase [Roseovarius sp. MMSF_3359]|uniref:AAA family ATPase n=1 Tax=unclassified Roseovarius TaxID=2614913 RepID=UPI0035326161